MEIQPNVLSLHGRRSKGNGKGISALDHARGRREEGSFPFSLVRSTRSRAPKFPLPLLTPATQAGVYSLSRLLLLLARDFARDIPKWRSCSQFSQGVTLVLSGLIKLAFYHKRN